MIVLYSPPKAQVVMVTGVLLVGAVAVPKGEVFVHWLQAVGPDKRSKIKKDKSRIPFWGMGLKMFCDTCFGVFNNPDAGLIAAKFWVNEFFI